MKNALINFKVGWQLGVYSLQFTLRHKSLLLLPFLSVIAMITACGLLFIGLKDIHDSPLIVMVGLLAAYFICIYIAVFFNVMTIAMVNSYLEKHTASFRDGFYAAVDRSMAILCWSLITGSVGLLIKLINEIEEKLHLPEILSAILEVGWAAATYFVVPIICFKGSKSPSDLYHESSLLIKNVWGDGVMRIIGSGFFVMVCTIPLWFAFYGISHLENTPYQRELYVGLGIIAAIVLAFSNVMSATLQTIFYKYADNQYTPPDLNPSLMTQAIVYKPGQ